MRLYDIYKNVKPVNQPLFKDNGTHEFMNAYNQHHNEIDMLLMVRYANRKFDFEDFGSNAYSVLTSTFNGWLIENEEFLEKIFDALKESFSPINNYDKTSTITTVYEGSETNSSSETFKGSEKNTNTETGSEVDTLVVGSSTDTVKNLNSPMDTETYYNVSKTEQTKGARTDTNTHFFNNRKTENEKTFADRENEVIAEKSFTDRTDTVTEHTVGNIGVSTSTSILNEYTEYYYNADFYKNMFSRFLKEVTY